MTAWTFRKPSTPTPHGTLGGYNNHGCRCEECTAANRRYQREYRRRFPERNNASGRPKETA